jgi:hypothetical protein
VSITKKSDDINWKSVLARKPGTQSLTVFYFPHIMNMLPNKDLFYPVYDSDYKPIAYVRIVFLFEIADYI